MVILELGIDHFGKLKNKEVVLRPGINVISGIEASGKTTVAAYIYAMLFGLKENTEYYTKYYPRDFDGVYGGKMKILKDGRFYRIERNFFDAGNGLKVLQMPDEEPVSNPEEWIAELVSAVDVHKYFDCVYISREMLLKNGEAADSAGELLLSGQYAAARERLYAKRAQFTQLDDIHIQEKLSALEEEERELVKHKDEENLQLPQTEARLNAAKMSYASDARRVQEHNAKKESDLQKDLLTKKRALEAYTQLNEKSVKQKNRLGVFLLVLSNLLALVTYFYYCGLNKNAFDDEIVKWSVLGAFGAAVLLFIAGISVSIVKSVRRKRTLKKMEEQGELYRSLEGAEGRYEYYTAHRDELEEKIENKLPREAEIIKLADELKAANDRISSEEKRLAEIVKERKELEKAAAEKEFAKKEITAIDMAVRSFERLGNLKSIEQEKAFSRNASTYFKKLSGDESISVKLSGGQVILETGENKRDISALPDNIRELLTLSLKMAELDCADPDKTMPLLLDEPFDAENAEAAAAGMDLLQAVRRQTIFFTRRAIEE